MAGLVPSFLGSMAGLWVGCVTGIGEGWGHSRWLGVVTAC